MKARIVRVGNSKGIRIPKVMLEETGMPDEVELVAVGNQLMIRPARRPREGWAEAFQAMHVAGDDEVLAEWVATAFDKDEWEW